MDFAVIVHSADLSKYHYMKVPDGDIMGLIMPKEHRLAANPYVELTDILDEPLICSRQSLTEDYPRWFGEQMDRLNIVATFNLIYNAAVLVKQGLGVALSFDRLVDTGPASPLCFSAHKPAASCGDVYHLEKVSGIYPHCRDAVEGDARLF